MKKQLRCVTIVRRKLLLYVMSALALIMAVVACSVTSSALLWSGVSTRKVPVYRVDTEKKKSQSASMPLGERIRLAI